MNYTNHLARKRNGWQVIQCHENVAMALVMLGETATAVGYNEWHLIYLSLIFHSQKLGLGVGF